MKHKHASRSTEKQVDFFGELNLVKTNNAGKC